jgi:hypothetical protein
VRPPDHPSDFIPRLRDGSRGRENDIDHGRYEDAEVILRQIAVRDPTKGARMNNLAWLLALRGDRGSEALDLINRAIALEGAVPGLRDTRTLAYLARARATSRSRTLKRSSP